MSKRNVLFLASWFPTRIHETSGNFNEKFAEAIAMFHQVVVLHVIADSDATKKVEIVTTEQDGYKKVVVYFRKRKKESIFNKIQKAYRYFKYYRQGYQIIREKWGRPDIVHNNVLFPSGLFALYLKKLHKIPYISTEHWTGYLSDRNLAIGRLRLRLTRTIARHAHWVCPVTEHLQHGMEQFGIRGNYSIVPNVVDDTVFYPSTDSFNNPMHFLHVSNCKDSHKNISGMLRAFDNFADIEKRAKLTIITEESVDDVYAIMAGVSFRNQAQLKVLGRQAVEMVAEFMRKTSCLLLFSNFETFSVVVAEAWSCGIPAIYSRCGGLTEINNPAIGIQVTKGDEQELFDALRTVSSGETHFDRSAILNQAREYGMVAVQEKFSALYDQVLKD